MNLTECIANYKNLERYCKGLLDKEEDIPWCYTIEDIYIDNFDLINIDISYRSDGYYLEASYSYEQENFKDFCTSEETT